MIIWELLVPTFEIFFIATFIYFLLSFFWNTRAMDLILGLFAFLGVFAFSGWLHLTVLQKMMSHLANYAALALVIIFQPEIRIALSKLSLKGKQGRDLSEFDHFLEQLSTAAFHLAEKKIGALIVLENQDSLEEFANNAVRIDAKFTPELLESIFMTTTPLHDGGVIIRGNRIISAATILPLSDDSLYVSKSMGTRHRAGLGISQITDALIVVISEETGKVSIAREGIMTRSIKMDRFKGVIKSIFTPTTISHQKKWSFINRIKVWNQ
ncbi:diadenylate cyclase CdaA [Chlamydiales bacterium]|nr:diadenylate cyclase CdaA [Chlamydiales bacterium]